jgi:hypothetical protein
MSRASFLLLKEQGVFRAPPINLTANLIISIVCIFSHDFVGLVDIDANIDEICDPDFEFKFGFNPFRFIADYLKWWHPNSAEQRVQDRIKASEFLNARLTAAKVHCGEESESDITAKSFESGIVYGPVIAPISESSVSVVAMAVLQEGHIAFELSTSSDFSEIVQRFDIEVGKSAVARTLFDGLKPSKKYFVRCSLFSAGELKRQSEHAIKLQKAAEAEVKYADLGYAIIVK